MIFLSLPITFVSLIWFLTIRQFRELAKAKFQVIAELEKSFEIKPFELEWNYYKIRNLRKFGLSQIEMLLPFTIFLCGFAHIVCTLIVVINIL